MLDIVNLQEICKIKEIVSRPFEEKENQKVITEINTLISKGWVLLKIYKSIHYQKLDNENSTDFEVIRYVLGFPHNGVNPVADRYRDEFSQE